MNQQKSNIFQSAWIVDDIESAALLWAKNTGIGPFFVSENKEGVLDDTTYRGEPSPITTKVALAQAGDTQVELIQPMGSYKSAYRDTVPAGTAGFHHIGVWINDLDVGVETYLNNGFEVAASGRKGTVVRFAYIDTSAVFGHMIELVEDTVEIRAFFKMIADAAIDWDGTNPLRYYE